MRRHRHTASEPTDSTSSSDHTGALRVHRPTPLNEALIWAFGVLLALAAIPITAALVGLDAVVDHPAPLVGLVLMFLLVEVLRVDIPLGPHSHSFTMSEVAVTIAFMTAAPVDVVIASTIAVALFFGGYRRVPPIKLVFNLGAVAFTTAIAAAIFYGLMPGDPSELQMAAAAIVATFSLSVMESLAVSVVIRLARDATTKWDLARTILYGGVVAVTSSAVGVQAVLLGRLSPWLVPLAAVPLAFAYAAYRGYIRERQLLERNDVVHRAALAMHEAANLDDGLLALLEHTRAALRAEFVRVVLFAPEGAVTVVARAEDAPDESLHAANPEVAHASHLLMLSISGTTQLSFSHVPAKPLLDELDIRDGLVAPLYRQNERAGILIAGNRLGNLDEFRRDDHDVVKLVSAQVGVALERGWLQQSLRQLLDLEAKLEFQANHDNLTGLANRRLFNERLEQLFEGTGTTTRGGALLLVDLDDFKSVNDTYGHLAGDDLLVVVARRLSSLVRPGDLVARIGGDEFALILDGVTSYHAATLRAGRVVDAIGIPVYTEDREILAKASVGIAITGDKALRPSELLRNADLALYHAKALGKDRYAVFQSTMHVEALERKRLFTELSAAVAGDELYMLYQPIHDIVNGDLIGAEALLRWNHPVHGEVPPSAFLPLAEETGLVVPIGEWVLRTVLRTAAEWSRAHPDRQFSISANLSARQLQNTALVELVEMELARTGLPADRLVLEITESAIIDDLVGTQRVLNDLAALGVHIALDDFGTGYSSLSHVRSFPLDQLKIDRSFVAMLSPASSDSALIGSIIHLADALGVTAVAEGIETEEQLAELRRLGCRVGQGYLMSRPISASAIARRLASDEQLAPWLGV